MSNNWKVYSPENGQLPTDIIDHGKYQWQRKEGKSYKNTDMEGAAAIGAAHNGQILRYRPMPIIAPAHETILTNWFEMAPGIWTRVFNYQPSINPSEPYMIPVKLYEGNSLFSFVSAEWFAGMPFAEFPPEVKA